MNLKDDELCRSLTNSGEPCKKRPRKGSRYCTWHSLSEQPKWKIVLEILAVVGAIVGVPAGIITIWIFAVGPSSPSASNNVSNTSETAKDPSLIGVNSTNSNGIASPIQDQVLETLANRGAYERKDKNSKSARKSSKPTPEVNLISPTPTQLEILKIELLQNATALYENAEYDKALKACDEFLVFNPGNTTALTLRKKIVASRNVRNQNK